MVLINFRFSCQLLALGLALLGFFEFALSCEFLLLLLQFRLTTFNLAQLVVNVLDLSIKVVKLVPLVIKIRCKVHNLDLQRVLLVLKVSLMLQGQLFLSERSIKLFMALFQVNFQCHNIVQLPLQLIQFAFEMVFILLQLRCLLLIDNIFRLDFSLSTVQFFPLYLMLIDLKHVLGPCLFDLLFVYAPF